VERRESAMEGVVEAVQPAFTLKVNPITCIERVVRPLASLPRDSGDAIVSKLKLMLAIVGAGYLAACFYCYLEGVYWGKPYPYNTFLYQPWDRFMDYHNMILMCRNLDPYNEGTRSGYPPFANIFFFPFSLLSSDAGFLLYTIIPVATLGYASWRLLNEVAPFFRAGAVIFLALLSYPFLFAIERGNLDLWIFVGITAFILNYNSPSPLMRDFACASLAFAVCFKMYPVMLLLLPAKDRRYMDCVKVGILVAIMTVASASLFQGGTVKAFHDFKTMMAVTDSFAKESVKNAHFNIGLFNAVVIILTKLRCSGALAYYVKNYWTISALILSPYVILVACRNLAFWEAATSLIIVCCLFPTLSYDYRVILLLPVILMQVTHRDRNEKHGRVVLVISTLLLIPKNYWHLFPELPPGDISIGSVVDPLLLFTLLNLIALRPGNVRTAHLVRVGSQAEASA
jgi:hypothetical protein